MSHLSLHQSDDGSHSLQGAAARDPSPEQSHLLVGLEDRLCRESKVQNTIWPSHSQASVY